MSQLPTVARSEGVTALERYGTDRLGQRKDFLSDARQRAAEAAAAADDAAFNRQKLAAEVRAQNLGLLGKRIGADTQVKTATIRAKTASADRAAKLRTEAAKLRTQAQIARERNLVSRANTLDTLAAKKEEAAKKATKPTVESQRMWTKRAREMWDGIPRTVTEEYTDPSGAVKKRQVTEYVQYDAKEIIRELMAAGASRAQATKIARLVSGGTNTGSTSTPSTNNPFVW